MKSRLITLALFLTTFAIHTEEIKIYRNKASKLEYFCSTLPAVGGVVCIGMGAFILEKEPLTSLFTIPIGVLGIGASIVRLHGLKRWNNLLEKPKLILDDEGFTYETSNIWGTTKDVHYLWKDVIDQWDNRVVNKYGGILRIEWCYHIRGENNIVTIIANELNIPEDIKAKVESMRRAKKS